ncbi:unnamed protein product, partial [Brenthis ino]
MYQVSTALDEKLYRSEIADRLYQIIANLCGCVERSETACAVPQRESPTDVRAAVSHPPPPATTESA